MCTDPVGTVISSCMQDLWMDIDSLGRTLEILGWLLVGFEFDALKLYSTSATPIRSMHMCNEGEFVVKHCIRQVITW